MSKIDEAIGLLKSLRTKLTSTLENSRPSDPTKATMGRDQLKAPSTSVTGMSQVDLKSARGDGSHQQEAGNPRSFTADRPDLARKRQDKAVKQGKESVAAIGRPKLYKDEAPQAPQQAPGYKYVDERSGKGYAPDSEDDAKRLKKLLEESLRKLRARKQ